MQEIKALVVVELKKLYRAPMNLSVLVLMPIGLSLIMYFALGNVYNDYYPVPGMNHFEYLLPGVMGYARLAGSHRNHPGFDCILPDQPDHCQYDYCSSAGFTCLAGGLAVGL